jgi:hypothetical protein
LKRTGLGTDGVEREIRNEKRRRVKGGEIIRSENLGLGFEGVREKEWTGGGWREGRKSNPL